jgi:hypothetical protein
LAMSCPITYWSRWATRVLGAGIDAKRASFEGRSGGVVGSGTGWGAISARALVAQKAQMRVVESKPPSKSGTLELRQKSQQGGWSDMETPKAGVSGPPTPGSRIPPSMVSVKSEQPLPRQNIIACTFLGKPGWVE